MRYIELNEASIRACFDAWVAGGPLGGVLALLPEAEKAQLPLLQAMCRERGVPLIGAIFPALLADRSFATAGAWLLGLPAAPDYFLLSGLNASRHAAADQLVGAVRKTLASCEAARPTLFLIFDGMLPNIASLLDELYLDISNRVDYAGVNAGSETFQPMPCLFDTDHCVADGVLGLLLPGEAMPVLEHGFTPPERSMSATSTEGNRIAMIDWRPAFDVYQEIIAAEYGIALTRENFYQYAVHFPFGILLANGDVVVRIPVALADDGSLICVGEVPENTVLVLLKAPECDAGHCVERLARRLHDSHGNLHGRALLAFYCAGRRMHLGESAGQELAVLQRETAAACLGGALSLGEIGSTLSRGYPMFHNATLVCVPWSGR